MNRSTAPLRAAEDALDLDTTDLDADAAFQAALAIVEASAIAAQKLTLALQRREAARLPRTGPSSEEETTMDSAGASAASWSQA